MDDTSLRITPHLSIPVPEISYRTSRSGGPGGQNVNKLETKVELLFDVFHSPTLTEHQRTIILDRLKDRIDSHGIMRVTVQQSRSQYQNKELALDRFAQLLRKALKPRKQRIKTAPSRSARERRMQAKRFHGEKKRMRKTNLE